MTVFLYLKAPETKRQWPQRLKVFLDFLKLDCTTIKEKAKQFMIKARYSLMLKDPDIEAISELLSRL